MKPRRLIKVDIISNLPVEILDAILVRLPLKDAVRTSILSRKWRDKWVTISELVVNDSSVPSTLGEGDTVEKLKFVSQVDQILLHHKGCVQKFALRSRFPFYYHLDQWIICLSRKGVKELIIDCDRFWPSVVSSRIFCCQDIVSLELHNYFMKLPPPSFEVFPNLKSLGIYGGVTRVHFPAISTLISKCPLLERLTLRLRVTSIIKINAPCLKFMDLSGDVTTVHFEHAPVLCEIFIGESNNNGMKPVVSDYNFLLSLCHLPYIRKLTLGTKLMPGWPDRFESKRLPNALCNLENLSVCINFEKSVSILGLLCLLRSSSGLLKLNLQTPRTTGFCAEDPSVAAVYWKAEKDLNCPMNNLLEVCITGVVGLAPELEFIKVLLANSPLLRKMTFTESCGNDKIFKELLQFKRASAEAEIFWI